MVAAYKFLRGNRGRPLLPHRLCEPVREMLLSMAEQARTFASSTDDDPRWLAAADALDAAAEALRRVAA